MKKYNNLFTKQYDKNELKPLTTYPNPQFARDSYMSLNGLWKYKMTKNPNNLNGIDDDILVPFSIESTASLVNKKLKKGEYIIYKTNFNIFKSFIKDLTFLHFMGVDQKYKIILNGKEYEEISPLNLPSKIDITDSIKLENELIVIVEDNLEYAYPLGKQSKKPKGIFYTPTSGIYFPVYLESVSNDYIKDIKISTTMDTLNIDINSSANEFNIIISENNKEILNKTINNTFSYTFENPINWEPSNPHLYDLEIKTKNDSVKSYFGLRQIELREGFIYLNNKKIFLNGVLDQGYYPEGIMTPFSYDSYEYDILTMKELGFNTLRKHLKIEMPYFYYLCDKHGMLVMQDFVNNGKYSFFKDTALPTIGFQKKNDKNLNRNKLQRSNYLKCAEEMIKYLNNNPSIVCYTIFNEGWGQFDSENVYKHFKKLYPNLIFDTASGWFRGASSDIDSYHLYFKNIDKLFKMQKPVLLSEFGAYCYKVKDHSYGNDRVFGYHYFDTINEVENQFMKVYNEKIIPNKNNLIGSIYTQLSDIEEEDNGLLSYDRKVLKLNKDLVKNTLEKLNK